MDTVVNSPLKKRKRLAPLSVEIARRKPRKPNHLGEEGEVNLLWYTFCGKLSFCTANSEHGKPWAAQSGVESHFCTPQREGSSNETSNPDAGSFRSASRRRGAGEGRPNLQRRLRQYRQRVGQQYKPWIGRLADRRRHRHPRLVECYGAANEFWFLGTSNSYNLTASPGNGSAYAIDLTGQTNNHPYGGIEQIISTTPGSTYDIAFYLVRLYRMEWLGAQCRRSHRERYRRSPGCVTTVHAGSDRLKSMAVRVSLVHGR